MSEQRTYPPIHPGRVLKLEFLEPLGMTASSVADAVGVDRNRLCKIAAGERSITGDTALRLARYFGNSPEFWINLQSRYDLEMARYKHGDEIERDVEPMSHV